MKILVKYNKTLLLVIISFVITCFLFVPPQALTWGFYTHKLINKNAIFILPSEMIGFYKKHMKYIVEHSGDPDRRTRIVPGEAEKHYIDIDHYGPNPFDVVPKRWKDAIAKYTEDTLREYGISPWNIEKVTYSLTQAFRDENVDQILYYSANLGHYIADITVPLHNTQYYNGKTSAQHGIHGFWESSIPELVAKNYTFFVGKAEYIESPLDRAWEIVKESSFQVDTIYAIYDYMEKNFPVDKKYVFSQRGNTILKQYSKEYIMEFEKRSNYMVMRKIRTAIHNVGSYWYTAWVNAGQPDLKKIEDKKYSRAHKKELKKIEKMWKTGKPIGRPNPEENE